MTKDRIRHWAWGLAVVFFGIGFFWVLLVSGQGLFGALIGGAFCAIIPLFVAAWLLFSPSPTGPLSYMGRRPPTLPDSDNEATERGKAKRKDSGHA